MTVPQSAPGAKTRVLVVDDSPFMRRAVSKLLGADQLVEVIGEAANGLEAVQSALALRPDVITMDVEMPRMDGVTAVGEIMASVPTPIVMVSTLTEQGTETAIRALEAGAVECVGKPSSLSADMAEIGQRLCEAVRRASGARLQRHRPVALQPRPAVLPVSPSTGIGKRPPSHHLVVIGSSTGGPPALTAVVPHLPSDLSAAVVVVQHMPAGFTGALARRLDSLSSLEVREAVAGEPLIAGRVFIAPGDFHLTVTPDRRVALNQGASLHGVRPSIDVTLDSVVPVYGRALSVAVLTGMGRDGADGAAKAEAAGGQVFVQDEASCVVYGMPRVTLERTEHARQVPITGMAAALAASIPATRLVK